jgi:hypothetical protein
MEFCLLDCLVLGTENVTGEVDLTELVLKVHLLTVCELSPLCILGAQKYFSLTALDFDLRELPYFSKFSKWVEIWKRVWFSPFVCLAVGYSPVMKR